MAGFKPYMSQTVNGTPLDNRFQMATSEESFFGEALIIGSTREGALTVCPSTAIPDYIGFLETSSSESQGTITIPTLMVTGTHEFIVTAMATGVPTSTGIGSHFIVSTSGTAVSVATSGCFRVTSISNTSDTTNCIITGYFQGAATTA